MTDRIAAGSRVVLRWRKWDGTAHWEHDVVVLGEDAWGVWLGQGAGWRTRRPGKEVPDYGPVVILVPPSSPWVATFYLPEAHDDYAVYVDIGWNVRLGDGEITAIDMDLDVIRLRDGSRTWIDDEDEWNEHRAEMSYPPEVQAELEPLAARLRDEVASFAAPFDTETSAGWMAALRALAAGHDRCGGP